MSMPSAVQRQFLGEATSRYQESLGGSAAEEFLESRGLMRMEGIDQFRLGYVANPLPGHEMYRRCLTIPYLRRSPKNGWSTVSIRFRCLREGCTHERHPGGKYISAVGDSPRMYNTAALLGDNTIVGICEGEIDAITASLCGIPSVGVPGVELWKPHFVDPFLGYQQVFIFSDGDDPGRAFANKVAKALPNSLTIPSEPEEDINSEFVKLGRNAILAKLAK